MFRKLRGLFRKFKGAGSLRKGAKKFNWDKWFGGGGRFDLGQALGRLNRRSRPTFGTPPIVGGRPPQGMGGFGLGGMFNPLRPQPAFGSGHAQLSPYERQLAQQFRRIKQNYDGPGPQIPSGTGPTPQIQPPRENVRPAAPGVPSVDPSKQRFDLDEWYRDNPPNVQGRPPSLPPFMRPGAGLNFPGMGPGRPPLVGGPAGTQVPPRYNDPYGIFSPTRGLGPRPPEYRDPMMPDLRLEKYLLPNVNAPNFGPAPWERGPMQMPEIPRNMRNPLRNAPGYGMPSFMHSRWGRGRRVPPWRRKRPNMGGGLAAMM